MSAPDVMKTYRRDDGGPIGDAQHWSTTGSALVYEVHDEPVQFVEESWVRVGVRRFVIQPGEMAHNPATCTEVLGVCEPCMSAYRMTASVS